MMKSKWYRINEFYQKAQLSLVEHIKCNWNPYGLCTDILTSARNSELYVCGISKSCITNLYSVSEIQVLKVFC